MKTRGVAAVSKAARLLRTFSPMTSTLSLRQLAERAGVPRSTAHALCISLVEAGLLEEVAGRGYRLGPALVSLGGHVIDRTGLVAAAEEPLRGLHVPGGLELHLGQLVEGWIVYLDRAGGGAPPMRNRVGLRAPAHRTGCGRAALSRLPPVAVAELVTATCASGGAAIPDLQELLAALERARTDGYAVADTFQRGLTSVAAPILDEHERPVGALSFAGESGRFTPEVCRQVGQRVTALAEAINRQLLDRAGT